MTLLERVYNKVVKEKPSDTVHILFAIADLKRQVLQQGAKLMSAVTDFSAKVEANFAAIKTGIQALDDKITAFQNSPGTLSATDQAALDAIVADSAALATAANALPSITPVAP